MEKEKFEQRIKELEEHRNKLIGMQDQVVAELNQTEGALKDCSYWLDQLNKQEEKTDG